VEVGDLQSAARKDSIDDAKRAGSGRAFQSVTVLGKEYFISAGRKWDECISSTLSGVSRSRAAGDDQSGLKFSRGYSCRAELNEHFPCVGQVVASPVPE